MSATLFLRARLIRTLWHVPVVKMPQLLLKRRQVRRGAKKWRKPVLRDYFKNDNYHCPVSLTNVWYLYVRESGAEIRKIFACGIRNPTNDWNPESSSSDKTGIQYLDSGIHRL